MAKWLLGMAILVLALMAGIAAVGIGHTSPIATYSGGAPAFMAAPSGTLALEDGCLYLLTTEGRRLIVFHDEEVAWSSDSQELTYRGATYRPGDHIELMGGTMDLRDLEGLRLPKGCVRDLPVIVAPSG